MKTAAPEDYQRLINMGESMLKNVHEHWDEIPAERRAFARFGQGSDSVLIAVGHLMLENIKQARDWFAIAGQFFLEGNRPEDTVVVEKRALECALFSADQGFQLRAARKISPREQRIKPVEYPYVMFLKHMILKEHSQALDFTEEAEWLSSATIKKRDGYGTLQNACKALADRDCDELQTALEALVKEHKAKVSHARAKLPDGILCFPGAALLILAREQGLNVDVASPFIPAALLD